MRRNHRSAPRSLPVYPNEDVAIELPPVVPSLLSNPIWVTWLQVLGIIGGVGGSAAYALMNRGNPNNPLWWIPLLSLTMMFASLASVAVQLTAPGRHRRQLAERARDYRKYLNDQSIFIDTLAETQRREHEIVHPSIEECILICANPMTMQPAVRMWERWQGQSALSKDFLHCRVGIGRIAASYKVRSAQQINRSIANDELVLELTNLINSGKSVPGAPVTVPLQDVGVLGVRGDMQANILRVLLIQLVTHHSPADVRLSMVLPEHNINEWSWLRWLPHIWNAKRTRRMMASSVDSVGTLLHELMIMMQFRLDEKQDSHQAYAGPVHVACFVNAEPFFQREDLYRQLMMLLNQGPVVGIYIILLSDEQLPRECRAVIETQSISARYIEQTSTVDMIFTPDQITLQQAERVARAQASWDSTSLFSDTSIPTRVTLLELLNVKNMDQYPLLERWKQSHPWDSLAVPVGLGAARNPVLLDVQKHYHGLGAGTTGSGKSELILTYIAMLAANFSPDELVFLLVDYKGEGMAGRVRDLPHLSGVLSNLSASQTNRVLISLRAELNRRQQIFKEQGINDINEYLRMRRQNAALPMLPLIMIIADEFAELKDEQPEFIDELVSVARIGRSLGVRMLLTTQNPSGGVVTKQIATNTSYRLCLRVATRDDSLDLIGVSDAAYLPGRGAGFVKVGESQPIQFQSGYTGDDYAIIEHEAPVVHVVSVDGQRSQVVGPKVRMSDETQLEYYVRYVHDVARANGYVKRYQVWTPPLPDTPPLLHELATQFKHGFAWNGTDWSMAASSDVRVLIGMYDDPANQLQGPLYVPISERNHIGVYVNVGEQRSLVIRTMMTSLALQYSPNDVQIIGLDFGASGVMRIFEDLPHMIAVCSLNQTETLQRIEMRLNDEIVQRPRVLGGLTFANYHSTQQQRLPRIVVVIDNIQELKDQTSLTKFHSLIEKIAQNGAPLGIHIVAMLNAPSDTVTRVRQQFGMQLGVSITNVDVMYEVAGKRKFALDDSIVGRGIASVPLCEVQLATIADDEGMQVDYIRALIADMNTCVSYTTAHQIREIPEKMAIQWIERRRTPDLEAHPHTQVFSYSIDTDKPVALSLIGNEGPYAMISGGAKSGKSTTLLTWARLLMQQRTPEQLRIYVMSNGSTQLFRIQHDKHVVMYETSQMRWPAMLEAVRRDLDAHEQYSIGITREETLAQLPMILLLIDSDDWYAISEKLEGNIHQQLGTLLQDSRDWGLCILAAGNTKDVLAAKNNGCEFTRRIISGGLHLVMNADSGDDPKIFFPELSTGKIVNQSDIDLVCRGMRPGRGVLLVGTQRQRVQVGLLEG